VTHLLQRLPYSPVSPCREEEAPGRFHSRQLFHRPVSRESKHVSPPVTFDHLGGVGPLEIAASSLASTIIIPAPRLTFMPTVINLPIPRLSFPALVALLLLSDSFPPPITLSAAAWRHLPHSHAPPRQLAVQFLGLNITRAYARHLYLCLDRLSSPSAPSLIPGSQAS
jgi:hypothetical protein